MKFPMKSLISRHQTLLIIFVIMFSQIMCNLPMAADESSELAEELLGVKIGAGLVYETVIGEKQTNECPEYTPPPSQLESYKFDHPEGEVTSGSKLTIRTPGGDQEYTWRTGYPGYCRSLSSSVFECIEFAGADGYTLKVFAIPSTGADSKLCYEAHHEVVLTEENLAEVAPPPKLDEQSSTNTIEVEACLATPDMYWVAFDDLHTESTDTASLCRSTYTLGNISDELLDFKSFLVRQETENELPGQWLTTSVGPGIILDYASSYKSVMKNVDGTSINIGQYTKLVVYRATAECRALITDQNETQWSHFAIDLDCPCND
jgi:hypothetical protein